MTYKILNVEDAYVTPNICNADLSQVLSFKVLIRIMVLASSNPNIYQRICNSFADVINRPFLLPESWNSFIYFSTLELEKQGHSLGMVI